MVLDLENFYGIILRNIGMNLTFGFIYFKTAIIVCDCLVE